MKRLAIVCTHPIQYYVPWFRYLVSNTALDLKVFYLWDFGVTNSFDPGFNQELSWDQPLLEGYEYRFVQNTSSNPGTSSFSGITNPTLISEIEAFAPECIITFGYNYKSLLQLLFSSKLRSIPKMLRGDSHRLVVQSGLGESLRKNLIKIAFKRFAAFLAVGRANADYYRFHGISDQNIFHTPHAIDLQHFVSSDGIEVKKRHGLPLTHKIVLFVGKFEEKKQPLELLAAFKQADPKDATLLFVGGGKFEQQLRHESSHTDNIRVLPFHNQSEMPGLYSAADLLVLPSYGKYETWGMAVHEAMATGVPALVSSHVGCGQDLVIEGSTGSIFRAGDYNDLQDKLSYLLSDGARLSKMGAEAKKRITERYSYQNSTEGLLKALSSIV